MFSIYAEKVFRISNRQGIILVGKTSGIIKIGDYLLDEKNKNREYKVIGIEMLNFIDKNKNLELKC